MGEIIIMGLNGGAKVLPMTATKQEILCSICAMSWGISNDEDYKDPKTNELVCNGCALDHEGTDYYEAGK